MINITFEGKYRIYNDNYNVILAKSYPVQIRPKTKRFGEENEKIIGYYPDLKSALNGYARNRMMDDETTISGSVEEIKEAINKIEETIKNLNIEKV